MVPFNPQAYYNSQIAKIKQQLADWDFSGAAETAGYTNSNLGPWGMSVPYELTDINGYISNMSASEKEQYQKLQEANKISKSGSNPMPVTKSTVIDNPNLNAQQLANKTVVDYWSKQSEPYSRVISAINDGTAKFSRMVVGSDEGGNDITELVLTTDPARPVWNNSLTLKSTDKPNVYTFSVYNQEAAGNIHGVLIGNPETGFVAPVVNAPAQFSYTAGSPGGFFRNIVSGITSSVSSLGPLGAIALAFATEGLSAQLGAAMGLEGAAATIVGNTVLQTTLNGGDVGKALTNSLVSYAGANAGGLAAQFAQDGELGAFLKANPEYAATIANTATRSALTGQSMADAVKAATVAVGTDAALNKIDAFKNLDSQTQSVIRNAVSAELQGKDVNLPNLLTNAAVSGLASYALNQNEDFRKLDPKLKGLLATEISAGLQGKPLDQAAIKWAINQGTAAINNAVRFPNADAYAQYSGDMAAYTAAQNHNMALDAGFPDYKTYQEYGGDKDLFFAKQAGFPDVNTFQEFGGDINAYKASQSTSTVSPISLSNIPGMGGINLNGLEALLAKNRQTAIEAGFPDYETYLNYDGNAEQYRRDVVAEQNHQTILNTFRNVLGRDPTPEEYQRFAGENAIEIKQNLAPSDLSEQGKQNYFDLIKQGTDATNAYSLAKAFDKNYSRWSDSDQYAFTPENFNKFKVLDVEDPLFDRKFNDIVENEIALGKDGNMIPVGNGMYINGDNLWKKDENGNWFAGDIPEELRSPFHVDVKYGDGVSGVSGTGADTVTGGSSTVTTPAGDISSSEGLRLKEVGALLGLGTENPGAIYRTLLGGGATGGPDGNWSLITVDAPLREQVWTYLDRDLNKPNSDLTQEEKDKLRQVADVIKQSLDQTKTDATKTDTTKTDTTQTDVTKVDPTKTDVTKTTTSTPTSSSTSTSTSGSSGSSGGGEGGGGVGGGSEVTTVTNGSTGANNVTATNGTTLTTGTSGTSGTTEATAITGTSGTSGTTGASEATGATGASGYSGYSGVEGASGASGYSGASGLTGLSGFSGFSGLSIF